MDDLISRADLFDELNRRGVPYNAEVNMVINGMPSVQPYTEEQIQTMQDLESAEIEKAYELGRESAQQEIIRCRDCKNGSPNGRYGCRAYHYKKYETHDMKPDDFCSRAERKGEQP